MPAPYGVTPTGYNAKTLEEIQADLEAATREELGATIDLNPETSAIAQSIGILADRLADVHQLGQAIYASAFPASSEGVSLDQNAALTGTLRAPATYSQVSVTFTGTPGTTIPAGTKVSNPSVPDSQFVTSGPFNIPGGGSVGTSLNAVQPGPIYALAGTITQIDTPVSGLASVNNPSDQDILGTNAELDPGLRLRQQAGLRAQGKAAFEAIRAALLDSEITPGVSDAFVFENEGDSTVDTIPPHAFEAIVLGATDAAVAATIFAYKPAGIGSHGDTTVAVLDSQGTSHDIKFTRPTVLEIWVTVIVTANANAPANIADLIKEAVAAYGDLNYRTGSPVIAQALVPSVFALPGIVDCTAPLIDTAPNPSLSTTIQPTRRLIAELDTSRIGVFVTRI